MIAKKQIIRIFLVFLTSIAFYGCTEEFIGQTPTDNTAPGTIKNPVVENLPGGAKITYELPDDNDLLYVKAVYKINGVEKNSTATMYKKYLTVEGFGTIDEQVIALYCVDRSGNHSEPVKVKINPTTPPVQLIHESMTMEQGFGGVQINWTNEHKADITIYLIAADSIGDLYIADVVYTSAVNGKFNLRGFDDSERLFGAFVRDRWDNYSDTLKGKYTPLYEFKLDKSLWKRQLFPGDNRTEYDGGSWAWARINDDVIGDQGWHTGSGSTPMYFTIDLGVTAKLSRYTLWHRGGDWVYAHHNPKKWTVYGSATPDFDNTSPEYWKEGFKSDWVHLIDCVSFKPSGDNHPLTQEDRDYANQGFEFELPLGAPPVRYVRFYVEQTWGGGDMLHISEISFWGKVASN